MSWLARGPGTVYKRCPDTKVGTQGYCVAAMRPLGYGYRVMPLQHSDLLGVGVIVGPLAPPSRLLNLSGRWPDQEQHPPRYSSPIGIQWR